MTPPAIAAREMQISTRPVIVIELHCKSFAIAQWLDNRDGTESCRMNWVQDATDAENIGMLVHRFIQENGWDYTPDIAYRVHPRSWIVTLR